MLNKTLLSEPPKFARQRRRKSLHGISQVERLDIVLPRCLGDIFLNPGFERSVAIRFSFESQVDTSFRW